MKKNEVVLKICHSTPLANYLKALGILRLISTHKKGDSHAKGWWDNDTFYLSSELGSKEIVRFFLEDYLPTPIIAPWNGGSGFYKKDTKDAIGTLRKSKSPRFEDYRNTIELGFCLIQRLKITKKEDLESNKDLKRNLILLLRNNAPESVVTWIDAVSLLTDPNAAKQTPLLGTMGNDGNYEFSKSFMQQLVYLFDSDSGKPTENCEQLLKNALYEDNVSGLVKTVVGQFSPMHAGGVNSSNGYEGEFLFNPWNYIFLIEGALLFAAAATRQMDATTGSLSYPFSTYASGVGHGSISQVDEENARGEIWMPLWSKPAEYREISQLFSEGRVQVHGKIAQTGVDFAHAIATLGVSRGIKSFQRFGVMKRNGKSYFITPLTSFEVIQNDCANLLNEFQRWLNRLEFYTKDRTADPEFKRLLHKIKEESFRLCQNGGSAQVQKLLIALSQVERKLAHNPKAREKILPLKLTEAWIERANDDTPEFRLALSLVSLRSTVGGVRHYLSPVSWSNPYEWNESADIPVVWNQGKLTTNLVNVLERRVIEYTTIRNKEKNNSEPLDKPFYGLYPADKKDIARYLDDPSIDARISELIWGLLAVDVRGKIKIKKEIPYVKPLPAIYLFLKLNFLPRKDIQRLFNLNEAIQLPIPNQLVSLLQARCIEKASEVSLRRLRSLGINHVTAVAGTGVDSRRLAAAMLFPIKWWEYKNSVLFIKEKEC